MGMEIVEVVLECPRPMNEEEFGVWERNHRPEDMILRKEYEPVGEAPAVLWRVRYLQGDADDAAMLL